VTVLDEVNAAQKKLIAAGIRPNDATSDAEFLARHALGWDRPTYFCRRQEPPPAEFKTDYELLVLRRTQREPVSAITGRREFWGLSFVVSPDVLTPRPETELIVEQSLKFFDNPSRVSIRIVDVGTGSGCLAIALAHEFPASQVIGTDVSAEAIKIAKLNASFHHLSRQIAWVQSSYLEGFAPNDHAVSEIDLIVANLPYVPSAATQALSPEVKDHDPLVALDGGIDGLNPLRALMAAAPDHLISGGRLIVEFGAGQEDEAKALIAKTPQLTLLEIVGDLSGIPRVASIQKSYD